MSFFIDNDEDDLEECIECHEVLKHKNDVESFCPMCGHVYNSELDTLKYKTKFSPIRELADSNTPPIVNMTEYGKVPDPSNRKLEPDKELKKYGTTILTDEVITYDD